MSTTWQEAYRQAVKELTDFGVAEAELDSWYLLEAVTGWSRTDFLMRRGDALTEEQLPLLERFQELVRRRGERIPLSYLTGWRNFCGLEFAVNEAVLIPRQDTECLVEALLPKAKGAEILDMCTGSGCIAISLAVLGKAAAVTGVDISEAALTVAKSNGERLAPGVRFLQSDLFEQVEGRFDIIVSNPPYIQSEVIETLEPEVKDHEPRLALDGTADGLFFYRRIVELAPQYLREDGTLAFEIGYDQGQDVSELMRNQGFVDVIVKPDLTGLDRVVLGRWAG